MRRSLRWLGWSAAAIAVILVAMVGVLTWVIATPSGTRWGVQSAAQMLEGKLQIEVIEGTLHGPLALQGVRYRDAAAGIDFTAQRIAVDLRAQALWSATVHVISADVDGVRLDLTEAQPKQPEPSRPFNLKPPIDIVIERFRLDDATVASGGEQLLAIQRADVGARWLQSGLTIERLDVLSAQGEVHFAGSVTQDQHFTGRGNGRFRWRAAEQLYAGTLATQATAEQATLITALSSPVKARLNVTLQQQSELPWKLQLEVPEFDPREALLPDSSIQSVALSLRGSGTQQRADLAGNVSINGERIDVDALRIQRHDDRMQLESLVVRTAEGRGALRAAGDVRFDQAPWRAEVRADWDEMILPPQWVGQELRTQGELRFAGNTAAFAAEGKLQLGPRGRMAGITLDIDGTPQAIAIEQLAIKQSAGDLNVRGRLQLQPQLAWQLQAQAQRFDPGVFLAAWPGDLAFALESAGDILNGAPQATLQLRQLRGELRNRRLSGHADLALTRERVLTGQLQLNSGRSRIELDAKSGRSMDAAARLEIPSLADWLPDAAGELHARLTARGRWPDLDIAAAGSGAALRVADTHIGTINFEATLARPSDPSGKAHIKAQELTLAGLSFKAVEVSGTGDAAHHSLALRAEGDPVGGRVELSGGRVPGGWSGSLGQLALSVKNVADMSLQQPVQLSSIDGAMRMSQACLADGSMQLCAAGESAVDGSLHATYSLRGVPLALAKTSASKDLPLDLSGTVEGDGDIRRGADGQLHGTARIASSHGKVATRYDEAAGSESQTLLEYRNFLLAATLTGSRARATLDGELNEGGVIDGELTLAGLGQPSTALQARIEANLPSLATVALFVPQLANVQGRAQLSARATGTLQEPQLSGELRATQLAAQVPQLGLNLHDGEVRITPRTDGEVDLAGEIASGKGKVSFDGRVNRLGSMEIKLRGKEFLAADIPAAQVLVNPDITVSRNQQRMLISGEVVLPSAKVDLQKLPRGGPRAQRASPDVEVVDEPVIEARDREQGVPMTAEVTVVLGEKVELTGFGLASTVSGRLAVKETPGMPTTASGDINVAGTYKAYGQDLTIRQGRLLYAGTPIDNPRLSIVAVRQVDDVTAGLRIAGTARSPQLSVFSEPVMGQAEALAYLVTGKPLDAVGTEDGDMMQSAARSLGTAAGGLLARRLGGRLGLDEVSVKESEVLEGAAFTVGEYLSPRLYLSYGVGLFEPGDVITLRYRLTKALALQALRGPEDTRAGVVYRIEK